MSSARFIVTFKCALFPLNFGCLQACTVLGFVKPLLKIALSRLLIVYWKWPCVALYSKISSFPFLKWLSLCSRKKKTKCLYFSDVSLTNKKLNSNKKKIEETYSWMHALFPPWIFLECNLFITAYLFSERSHGNKRIMFFGLPDRVAKPRWERYPRTMLIESQKKKTGLDQGKRWRSFKIDP